MSTAMRNVAPDMTPEARRTYVGPSEFSTILGLNPYKSARRLAQEKMGIVEPDDLTGNQYVLWGTLLEPVIRRYHAETTGRKIIARHIPFVHPKYDFIRTHVDGHIVGDARGSGLVEIKTAGYFAGASEDWGPTDTDLFPLPYMVQVRGALATTGWKHGELVALIGGNDFRVYPFEADLEVQDHIIERVVKFWEATRSGKIDDLQATTDDLKREFPRSFDAKVEASDAIAGHVQALAELARQQKELEERVDGVKAIVQSFMGERDTLTYLGASIATWKSQTRKSYVVKETSFRKFTIAKGN